MTSRRKHVKLVYTGCKSCDDFGELMLRSMLQVDAEIIIDRSCESNRAFKYRSVAQNVHGHELVSSEDKTVTQRIAVGIYCCSTETSWHC